MTKILILGGGGMVGQKLAQRIAADAPFADPQITLFDRAFPPQSAAGKQITGDVSDPAMAATLAPRGPM